MFACIPAENDQINAKTIRHSQIETIVNSYRVVTTTINCKRAFECCGIFPRDPSKVLGNKLVKKSKTNLMIQH